MKNVRFGGGVGVALALALSLAAVTPVLAATTATKNTTTKNTTGTAVKTVVQATKVDLQSLLSDIQNRGQQVRTLEAQKVAALKKIDAAKKDAKRLDADQKTLNFVNDARNRLQKAISDLENIAAQIDSRIITARAAGRNTGTAEQNMALARANIQAAKDHVAAFTNTQNTAINAEKLADGIVIVGTALTDIETSLKTARQNLTDAVTALKAISTTGTKPANTQ